MRRPRSFLYVVPENVVDLPEELQADGSLNGWALTLSAAAAAALTASAWRRWPLPDYPGGIKEIGAGQYIPDQGRFVVGGFSGPGRPGETAG